MKHTEQQLIDIAHLYFPQLPVTAPGHEQTPEAQRRQGALAVGRAQYPTWVAMLRRIEARFPEGEHPGVSVQNLSMGLLAAGSMVDDLCYSAYLWLPLREAAETSHCLTFRVSFVVPYHSIRSESLVRSRMYYARSGGDDVDRQETFDLAPEEQPYAAVLDEEIAAAYPGHERMPADVGQTVVPGVQVGSRMAGGATLFDCLFSSCW